ncbi:hypothetical protein JMJ77_0003537, partial [Colletotrichum scovillei]
INHTGVNEIVHSQHNLTETSRQSQARKQIVSIVSQINH